VNLLEVMKVAERLKRIVAVLEKAASKRLGALIIKRGETPMEDSEVAIKYEEGFKHGLNAGLQVSETKFADLDAELLCEAFNCDIDQSA